MKYVMLGTLSGDWATRQKERTGKARAKLEELGITLEALYYTQGTYDFVDVVEAPDAEAMLAFSVWYAKEGLGRITTMPAFSEAELQSAVDKT
ncbi:MAG: GYD domain-containing protein [Alphaproteobacteria bacterium]|nr:GYD domain-containing protein [Alphaproteobacteria bacterium]